MIERRDESLHLISYDFADDVLVNKPKAVNEPMTQGNDFSPRDLRLISQNLFWNPIQSFTDRHKAIADRKTTGTTPWVAS